MSSFAPRKFVLLSRLAALAHKRNNMEHFAVLVSRAGPVNKITWKNDQVVM